MLDGSMCECVCVHECVCEKVCTFGCRVMFLPGWAGMTFAPPLPLRSWCGFRLRTGGLPGGLLPNRGALVINQRWVLPGPLRHPRYSRRHRTCARPVPTPAPTPCHVYQSTPPTQVNVFNHDRPLSKRTWSIRSASSRKRPRMISFNFRQWLTVRG